MEDGSPRAFGAGLLSSFGEIERLEEGAELLDFNVEEMALRDYDPTDYQPALFVASNWEEFDQAMVTDKRAAIIVVPEHVYGTAM